MSIRSSAYAEQNQHFTSEVLNWDCLLTCIHKLYGFFRKFCFCSSAGEGTHLKCNLLPCMWQLKFSCGLSRILLLFSLQPTGGLFNDLYAFIPAVGKGPIAWKYIGIMLNYLPNEKTWVNASSRSGLCRCDVMLSRKMPFF